MAALKYRDEHNKVGFLEKPKGSADYHQVLDFLRGSHIRQADLPQKQILTSMEVLSSHYLALSQFQIRPSSDPNIASSSRLHESAPDLFTSTNVEDETMGGSFHTSSPRSTQAPPAAAVQGGSRKAGKEDAEEDVILLSTGKAAATAASCFTVLLRFMKLIFLLFLYSSDEFAGGSAVPADSDWNDIMSQVHANQGLTADLLGPDVNDDNFAERMVALIAKRRRDFAAQRFQDKRNKPMTYAQQKAYMRTFVKNQSSTIYTTGWTMKHVKSFSDDQLKTEFDKIRAAVAELKSLNIKRSLKRPGADLEQASSKKSKPTEAPQSSVPDESQQPSVEVPSQKATTEDVEVPSNTASTAQHTASSLKKDGTRKKRLGRKGVNISHSTIPIED
ncbi:hypothetical protein Tco_0705246 [Tanacetum coccineum]|uniref:Uncharacterized protein n=1 Tax=Tanacetum coccineum TaxID=301880 RepID=A0ABQ4Y415_9ASTR